ncbi:MAG TPA: radical SAM protein, partial [Vicinamibacteria bacterium]|nr:radical SAM protein [Vicinamibacteria bacterium]
GFLGTLTLLRRLKMTKVVRVGRRYHFSLMEPGWPSPAYDRMIAKGGLNLGASGSPAKEQIDLAVLGITRTCPYRCAHCYERYNLGDRDVVSAGRWSEAVRELQDIGVSVIALSGGEPLGAMDRTLEILRGADKSRSDFHLYTAGCGATAETVGRLVEAGLAAAAVGLDDFEPARHDRLRNRRGAFQEALHAIELFSRAGILVYANTCLTHELVREDGLLRFYELARGLGLGAIQLLEPRPCGGYAGGVSPPFGDEDRAAVRRFFAVAQDGRRYRAYPAVYHPAWFEAPENLGCLMAGLSHLYIDSLGNVEPCVFLPVAFGNIRAEPFTAIYARMRRAVPRPIREACPAVALAARVGFGSDKPLPLPYESLAAEWPGQLRASASPGRTT